MIRLERSFYPKVWGATALGPWFDDAGEQTGEVWFTHSPPLSLLIKFIFTTDRLSVQVHPDDEYAAAHEHSAGKTEMWHVLRAAPGAAVAAGFREAVSPERARAAARSGEIEELVQWWPVEAGDTFFIPAGTVHAVGAGVVLCEIQQNSDVTYRLYDYGRPRQLHLDRALDVARLDRHPGPTRPRRAGLGMTELTWCRYFATDLVVAEGQELDLDLPQRQIVIVLEGSGRVAVQQVLPGEVWLAEPGEPLRVEPAGRFRLLRTYAPVAGENACATR